MHRFVLLLYFSILVFNASAQQRMDNGRLDSIFRVVLDTVDGGAGQWEFVLAETPMLCITDEVHDRMRIISPIKTIAEATAEEIRDCMEANFHSALDVKYALADDVIWVAFIHPLSPLTDRQLVDAIAQVRSAVVTYGSTYTSTDLVFPNARKTRAARDKKRQKL